MAGMNETDTPRLLGNVSLLHVPPLVTSSRGAFFCPPAHYRRGVLHRQKKYAVRVRGRVLGSSSGKSVGDKAVLRAVLAPARTSTGEMDEKEYFINVRH